MAQSLPVTINACLSTILLCSAFLLLSRPASSQSQQEEKTPVLSTDFPCGLNMDGSKKTVDVERIKPNHFRVTFPGGGREEKGWFLFRLDHAGGRTVRIDLDNVNLGKWSTINPVYAAVENLSDPSHFQSMPPGTGRDPVNAPNGPLIPDTSRDDWRYIRQVTTNKKNNRLTFVHRYPSDRVYVAMRPPFTPAYLDNIMKNLKKAPAANVHQVGTSPEGRPLYVVRIGKARRARNKPVVVIYVREHADEHDTSWVAEGAIRYLSSDQPEARALRSRAVFLILPLLDPDGAAISRYNSIMRTFVQGKGVKESIAYARFFKQWANRNHRLDLVFNLHNVESNETDQHIFCPHMRPEGYRLRFCRKLNSTVMDGFEQNGYVVDENPAFFDKGFLWKRLGWYLAEYYATLHLPYELNSQSSGRHLTLYELRRMGKVLVKRAVEYLYSDNGKELLNGITRDRRWRAGLLQRYRPIADHLNDRSPMRFEEYLLDLPSTERFFLKRAGPDPDWLKTLYSTDRASPRNIPSRTYSFRTES